MTFTELLVKYAKYIPDGIAIVQGDRSITWKQLNEQTNRLANAMLHLGITKGDKGVILTSNCIEFFELNFAMQKIGAVPIPINYRFLSNEIDYVVNNSDAALFAVSERFKGAVIEARPNLKKIRNYVYIGDNTPEGMLNYKELVSRYPPREPKVKISDSDSAMICYTGGTTGWPKGVVLTYDNFLKDIEFLLQFVFQLPPKIRSEPLVLSEFERRLVASFSSLMTIMVDVIKQPQFSGKMIAFRLKSGSVTFFSKDGQMFLFKGEPEKPDVLFIWKGDMLSLNNEVMLYMNSKKFTSKLKLLPLILTGKLKMEGPLRHKLIKATRKSLKGKGFETKMLVCPPFFHLAAYASGLVMWISTGIFTIILPTNISFEPEEVLGIIEKEKTAFIVMVPTMWKRILEYLDTKKIDTSCVTLAISGAAVLQAETKKRMLAHFQNALVADIFGQTEMAPVTTARFDGEIEKVSERCVGKPLPGIEARVVDDAGGEVECDKIGEIIYRGPTVMKEYYGDPERTAKVTRDGWFHSGDLGWMDKEGSIYILERKEECITSGGEKIYPFEIEEVILKNPKVKDVVVIGVPDEEWGHTARAVVLLKEGEKATGKEVIDWCRNKIAGYKIPKSAVFVDSFPISPVGKVLRGQIKETYGK